MEKTSILTAKTINKYDNRAIRWLDEGDHYELIFTDDFVTPSSGFWDGPIGVGNSQLTDILLDMRAGNKSKEVHVFVGSFGGEVAALNMILQQLLTYEYRVGINLGTACSCGWILLFACQERYVSPFSQAMYHDIAHVAYGKHSEIQRSAEHSYKWQQQLLKATDADKVLTERELELGKTTEVWFTGQELIERGAAKDYGEYLTRKTPMPGIGLMMGHDGYYIPGAQGWTKVELVEHETISYAELLRGMNSPEEPAAAENVNAGAGPEQTRPETELPPCTEKADASAESEK